MTGPVLPEILLDSVRGSHQKNSHRVFLNRLDASLNLHLRSQITAHGVDSNPDHRCSFGNNPNFRQSYLLMWNSSLRGFEWRIGLQSPELTVSELLLSHLDDFAAVVIPAMWTRPVGHLQFMAIRALRSGADRKKIMSSPLVPSRLGVAAFRVWHVYLLL